MQLPKMEHDCFFVLLKITFIFLYISFYFLFFIGFNFPIPAAAKSRAIPRIPKQSGLFGVIDNSIVFSLFEIK